MFSSGGTSFPDFYLALLLLSLCLISTTLNPLVLLHNYRKQRRSLARLLFMGLASVDLVACLVLPLYVSVGLIAEKDMAQCVEWGNSLEACKSRYWKTMRSHPPAGVRVLGAINWMLFQTPGHITGFLAVTRYYQIRRPFARLSRRLVVGLLSLSLCYTVSAIGVAFRDRGDQDTTNWFPTVKSVYNNKVNLLGWDLSNYQTYIFLILMTVVIQLAAITASILTVLELVRTMRAPLAATSRANSKKGSVKILLTNLGSVFSLCSILTMASLATVESFAVCFYQTNPDNCMAVWGFIFIYSDILPAVTSALNPAIYLALTPRRRQRRERNVPDANAATSNF